jgi:hypothetical protein
MPRETTYVSSMDKAVETSTTLPCPLVSSEQGSEVRMAHAIISEISADAVNTTYRLRYNDPPDFRMSLPFITGASAGCNMPGRAMQTLQMARRIGPVDHSRRP